MVDFPLASFAMVLLGVVFLGEFLVFLQALLH